VYCKPNVIRVASRTPYGQRVSTWDASVISLQAVYSRLYSCGAHGVVVFPYGIVRGLRPARASVPRLKGDRALLLPNLLCADPPFSSAPPRDFEDAWAFVDAMEESVRLVHHAGVVHGDLYLSNILHRRQSGISRSSLSIGTLASSLPRRSLHRATAWQRGPCTPSATSSSAWTALSM